MRQQTVHALGVYLKAAAIRYAETKDKAEALDILARASSLTPLIEYVGIANES